MRSLIGKLRWIGMERRDDVENGERRRLESLSAESNVSSLDDLRHQLLVLTPAGCEKVRPYGVGPTAPKTTS